MNFQIVTATRLSLEKFCEESWLWKSLTPALRDAASVTPRCTAGLPVIYNEAIDSAPYDAVLVFVHDDLFISDLHLVDRLDRALGLVDVVGLAGNARRVPRQDRWISADGTTVDREYIRGAVAHPRADGLVDVHRYGPTPSEVKLLDGALIAARTGVLRGVNARFDERFRFHFYDLDFCRTCETRGVKLGTWPIAAVHKSTGSYGSAVWRAARDAYFEKWGD